MLVLKTSDYWVQTGGTEYLPEKWIYYSQIVDQMYQVMDSTQQMKFVI